MIRASLFMAALAALPCVRAWADQTPPGDSHFHLTSRNDTVAAGVAAKPESLGFQPSAWLQEESNADVVPATPENKASAPSDPASGTASGNCGPVWHHIPVGCESCAPHICRFDDYWTDWPCCTTTE
jgi:hypothetical protein